MATYKVTNITSGLGKRDSNFNTTLKIDYVDEMMKKNILLKPNDVLYFTTDKLPLSLHRYRVKQLVSISEISDKELSSVLKGKSDVPKSVVKKQVTTTTTTKKASPKKGPVRKSSSKKDNLDKTVDVVSSTKKEN